MSTYTFYFPNETGWSTSGQNYYIGQTFYNRLKFTFEITNNTISSAIIESELKSTGSFAQGNHTLYVKGGYGLFLKKNSSSSESVNYYMPYYPPDSGYGGVKVAAQSIVNNWDYLIAESNGWGAKTADYINGSGHAGGDITSFINFSNNQITFQVANKISAYCEGQSFTLIQDFQTVTFTISGGGDSGGGDSGGGDSGGGDSGGGDSGGEDPGGGGDSVSGNIKKYEKITATDIANLKQRVQAIYANRSFLSAAGLKTLSTGSPGYGNTNITINNKINNNFYYALNALLQLQNITGISKNDQNDIIFQNGVTTDLLTTISNWHTTDPKSNTKPSSCRGGCVGFCYSDCSGECTYACVTGSDGGASGDGSWLDGGTDHDDNCKTSCDTACYNTCKEVCYTECNNGCKNICLGCCSGNNCSTGCRTQCLGTMGNTTQ